MPVYVLIVSKGGPHLKHAAPDLVQRVDATSDGSLRKLTFASSPISSLARNLARQLKQTVIDRTGLQGQFDGTLEWSTDLTDVDSTGPSIFTAVQQQLGLKLQLQKTPIDVLVIDSVREPDAN